MNYQHFSHHHILIPLSPPEPGQSLICHACRNPITEAEHDAAGDGLHGCLPCRFYVHDRCLNAPRWLDHPAHRAHPLTLFPCPTYSHSSFLCNACGLSGGRSSCFGCAKCEFDLHLHCATLPESLHIDAHPDHHLKLYYEFPDHNPSLSYMCDVCGENVDSRFWIYRCAGCGFDCHVNCATSSRRCSSHSSPFAQPHPLPPTRTTWLPSDHDQQPHQYQWQWASPQSESGYDDVDDHPLPEQTEGVKVNSISEGKTKVKPQPVVVETDGDDDSGDEGDDVESSMARLMAAQNELKLAQMRMEFMAKLGQSIVDLV